MHGLLKAGGLTKMSDISVWAMTDPYKISTVELRLYEALEYPVNRFRNAVVNESRLGGCRQLFLGGMSLMKTIIFIGLWFYLCRKAAVIKTHSLYSF